MLDVGAGDGLIAFGALELVGPTGQVVFADVSQALLDHCRRLATDARSSGRCRFLLAAAEDLDVVDTASVDAVTTRSVLIYVADKPRAFSEFHRVLRPGGRISIWEPVNALMFPEPAGQLWGIDVAPIGDLAERVKTAYFEIRGPEPAMMGFDDRDLLSMAEAAGFEEIQLELRRSVTTEDRPIEWSALLASSPNPLAPTWGEVIDRALGPAERAQFAAYLQPRVEQGRRRARLASAHLWAQRSGLRA